MSDLKLDDIADRIIDAVINEPHINRMSLKDLIKPILKIWLKTTDAYKKTGIPKIDNLNYTIEKRTVEYKYFRDIVRNSCSPEQMTKYYEELNQQLISQGFIK